MQSKYSFVCDGANISTTGKLNVLGIFRKINLGKVPFKYPQMSFVSGIEFDISETGKHRFKLRFIDGGGKELIAPLGGDIIVNANNLFANIHVVLNGINIPDTGRYEIYLTIDDQLICEESIRVDMIKSQQH